MNMVYQNLKKDFDVEFQQASIESIMQISDVKIEK